MTYIAPDERDKHFVFWLPHKLMFWVLIQTIYMQRRLIFSQNLQSSITKTYIYLYNFDPLKPNFCIGSNEYP